jgi:PAS domain-containing protein
MTYFQYLQQLDPPWKFSDENAAELATLDEGVIVANAEGSLIFANAMAISMHGRLIMGVHPEDYSPVHGLFTEDGRPYPSSDLPLVRAAVGGETVMDARWRIRRPDGSSVLATGDAMPLYSESGRHTGGLLIFRVEDL